MHITAITSSHYLLKKVRNIIKGGRGELFTDKTLLLSLHSAVRGRNKVWLLHRLSLDSTSIFKEIIKKYLSRSQVEIAGST